MKCPRCHIDMEMTVVSETEERGTIGKLVHTILLCLPIFGWAVLLIMRLFSRPKVKGVTYAVCPKCGRRRRR